MEVFYDDVKWYGKDKNHLYVNNLQIDYINYGTVIMDIETNVFAKQVLDYLNEKKVDIQVLDLNNQPVQHEDTNDDMISKAVTDAVQNYLDSVAKEKRYNDSFALVSYANSTNTTFATEAKKFIAYRDECWKICFDTLSKYEKREIPLPTPDDVIKQFPKINWD